MPKSEITPSKYPFRGSAKLTHKWNPQKSGVQNEAQNKAVAMSAVNGVLWGDRGRGHSA